MNHKTEYQYKMTVDYLRQMTDSGLLTEEELETAITLAKARYQISDNFYI